MRLAVGRLVEVRMGMWGSLGPAVGGRRVVERPRAVKRGASSLRMQSEYMSVSRPPCFGFDERKGERRKGEVLPSMASRCLSRTRSFLEMK